MCKGRNEQKTHRMCDAMTISKYSYSHPANNTGTKIWQCKKKNKKNYSNLVTAGIDSHH